MNLADSDFKSRWPFPTSFSAISKTPPTNDPLLFIPNPKTLTLIINSPSISPNLPTPLSLSSPSLYNSLSLLRVPGSLDVLVFFPVDDDYDRIGFAKIRVFGSEIGVVEDGDGDEIRVSDAEHELIGERIVKLLITPFPGNSCIGFLIACTVRGIHCYSVEIDNNKEPKLKFIGCKVFKTCGVIDACWSPHIPEECVVLLQNGKLVLFDMNEFCSGKRLRVSWEDQPDLVEDGWLGCEFCWHPEILVVAHSNAVFLLDFRKTECVRTCLLEIGTSAIHTPSCNDRFFAFSKAGSDHHLFVVALENRVVLFDVRKALMPLLQWSHDIPNPSYINVYPLSQLRVYRKDENGSKGSFEVGNCIIMGSFWNCEFNLFCYGPPKATNSEISKYDNKLCALDIPSEILLSGRDCSCGSCLVREEFWKDSLLPWIDWRQKKEIVLGFGIIDKDLDTKLSEQSGFTVIRLMSSGNIESQRYIPSHDFVKTDKKPVKKSVCDYKDPLLFPDTELIYKFPKRFMYQKLDYLCAYMKDVLDEVLLEKIKDPWKVEHTSDYISSLDFHQSVCDKLKESGFDKSSFAVSDLVKCTRIMSSVHEVAMSKIWIHLPSDLLRMAFSYYSEVSLEDKKVSLEFLDIPNQPQTPPFLFREPSKRSSKWTQKVRPSTGFVGPLLSTPVMLTISALRKEDTFEFSANSEIRDHCNEVIEVANNIAMSADDDFAVSLDDDNDKMFDGLKNKNVISVLKVLPKTYEVPTKDATSEDPVCYDDKFTTFICKKPEKDASKTDGSEMFDLLSPIELKFDGPVKLGSDTTTLKFLTKRYSKFLQNYDPYQQFLKENNLDKQE